MPFRVQSPEASTEGSLLANNLYGHFSQRHSASAIATMGSGVPLMQFAFG